MSLAETILTKCFYKPAARLIAVHIAGMFEEQVTEFSTDPDGIAIPLTSGLEGWGRRDIYDPIDRKAAAIFPQNDLRKHPAVFTEFYDDFYILFSCLHCLDVPFFISYNTENRIFVLC